MTLLYAFLQLPTNILSWAASPETQAKYQYISLARQVYWWVWVCLGIVIFVGVTIEGALRAVKAREDKITALEVTVNELEERLAARAASYKRDREELEEFLGGKIDELREQLQQKDAEADKIARARSKERTRQTWSR